MRKIFHFLIYLYIGIFLCSTTVVKAGRPVKTGAVPYVDARCAIALDAKSRIVLFERSSDSVVPMASTTKIITALVAIKYGDLDRKVKISRRAASIRGSTVGYKEGEEIKLRELVYGLMLRSGNDAAIAIAEGISGSVDEFCKLMNEFAHEVGLVNSNFESPHGLDSQNHYTTAYDLALATVKARECEEFCRIVSAKDIDGGSMGFSRSFHNINKILWQLPNANGVKTGYTGQAGKCLVSSVRIGGNDIIIVILNSSKRWRETVKINDYIESNYEYRKIISKDEILGSTKIKGIKEKVQFRCSSDIVLPVKKSSSINKKVVIPEKCPAPLPAGTPLGRLEVYEDDKLLYSTPMECADNISREGGLKSWLSRIKSSKDK